MNRGRKMVLKASQAGIAAIMFFVPLPSSAQTVYSYQIRAMIYQTPPAIFTWTWGGDDGKGGIVGGSIGGMITSAFPDAIVLLKLGGPGDFSDLAIRERIAKEFVFRCGEALSKGLPADLLHEFAYDTQKAKDRGDGGCQEGNIFPGRPKDSMLQFRFGMQTMQTAFLCKKRATPLGSLDFAPECPQNGGSRQRDG